MAMAEGLQEGTEGGIHPVEVQDLPATYPTAPAFDFNVEPVPLASIEAGNLDSEVEANFFRSARWYVLMPEGYATALECIDGTAILTTGEDRIIRIFQTPSSSFQLTDESDQPRYQSFQQPDAIHAVNWYPSASVHHPETYVFLASVRDTPVRLIDAATGRIRAKYPIIDHTERFIAPHCFAFNPTATKVYCGHEGAIEVLDIASPGPGNGERIKTAYTKREKGGQKGIISALAFSTDMSGLFAAGSYSGSVSLYQEDGEGAVLHLEGIQGGGVTQVQFHPLSPSYLFVASRRSDAIQVYDIRSPTQVYSTLPRKGNTNQRLQFDIDPWGRYLVSGDQDGWVRGWDISQLASEPAEGVADPPMIFERKLHSDAISSVQLHPYKPYLLTASGSRAYLEVEADGADLDVSEDETESDSEGEIDDDNAVETISTTSHGVAGSEAQVASPAAPSEHRFSQRSQRHGGQRRRPADTALRIWSLSNNQSDVAMPP